MQLHQTGKVGIVRGRVPAVDVVDAQGRHPASEPAAEIRAPDEHAGDERHQDPRPGCRVDPARDQ